MVSSVVISVRKKYTDAINNGENVIMESQVAAMCCSEVYDQDLINNVPASVVKANFGCGNPTKYIRTGDVVLDLGCGAGLNCYIAAQIVGSSGKVIGIDVNESMLELARNAYDEFKNFSHASPIQFSLGSAHDLALDLEQANWFLKQNPPSNVIDIQKYLDFTNNSRSENPLIPNESVDVVISNCVINLLSDSDKPQIFKEIFRVLKPGGRFAISDNVSNIPVPYDLKSDTLLWSACYAGVLQEQAFYQNLEKSGFVALTLEVRNVDTSKIIDDLKFYSITITGEKPLINCCYKSPTVIYRGPSKGLIGDSGKLYKRGVPEKLEAADDALIRVNNLMFIVDDEALTPTTTSCC
jgi:ubiquinone/menaquinone biosynthesis C-methylase UbiE